MIRDFTRPSNAGFSLIEMLIIMAILGIVGGISVFGYRQVQSGQEAKSGIASIRLIMAHGATAASSRGVVLDLVKSGDTLQVQTQDATPVVVTKEKLPSSIAFQLPSTNPILQFNQVGRLVFPAGFNNPITLSSRGRTYALTVSLIGEVKMEVQ